MEQTIAPPPPSAVTNPDSVTSSPRFLKTDSYKEDNPSTAATTASATGGGGGSAKLRLMCSYGGHIVPRPHDKTLCYVGGDTRIVVVDRHTTLSDLTNRLTKTLLRSSTSSSTTSFTVKYQLPSEDLDSLISVTTDEDLENMIDEYDRLNLNLNSNRLRLFLFPVKPESVTSIGSLLESSTKSEDWFLNALNGTTSSGFSDTSSVNCLLGLEDDVAVLVKKDGVNINSINNINNNNKGLIGKNIRGNQSAQDVQSVPDSPMMETTSSFGSASSSPPVRGNVEDIQKVEEQFSQISVQQHVKAIDDVNFVAVTAPAVIAGVPVVNKVGIVENFNRVLSEDERSDQGFQVAQIKQQQQQYQQKFDMASPDSVSSDGSVRNPLSRQIPPVSHQDPFGQTQFSSNSAVRAIDQSNMLDQNTRIQIQQPQQQVQDSGYVISTPTTQVDPQHPQVHHQPQFIHTAVPQPQYLHHHPSGAVPMASYYQMYPPQSQIRAPHPALDQQNFVYYMPARQAPQGYNLPMQADPAASAPPSNQVPPPSGLFATPRSGQTTVKTEQPAGVYRTAASSGALPPQMVQVPSSQHQIQPQFVGYSHIHQPPQPVTSGASGNYVYELADPSQQGQHIYYAAQPLPPQSTAQYQTMTSSLPVEAQAQAGAHLQADNIMKQQQQVRTSSQP